MGVVGKNIEEAHTFLSLALLNFYKRRKTDIFVASLIRETKELIEEAQQKLDSETIGVPHEEPDYDEDNTDFDVLSPIPLFSKYLELIFAKDELWNNFQMYVRQSSPRRGEDYFEYHRNPECIEIWRQMLDNMGGGFPLSLFASTAFLLLEYREQGHNLDAELEALHEAKVRDVNEEM